MTDIEQIEMSRYRSELEDDVRHMVKKYCRIMSWEVPQLDELRARQLILSAIHDALAKLETEQ
jgi:hypothetical protein